jgi:hypothetical protein
VIYFGVSKRQVPVVEHALEMAARMLGSDRSRGYCLEMICADFLAGVNLQQGDSEPLLHSLAHLFHAMPGDLQQRFLLDLARSGDDVPHAA